MKLGYIRLSKRGQSEAAQRAAINAEDVPDDRIAVDDQRPKKKGGKVPPLIHRGDVLQAVRRGDVLVVASAGRLGVSREDARAVIEQVGRQGGKVQVAGGEPFGGPFGGPQLAALIAFEAALHAEVERERTDPARAASSRRGENRRKSLTGKKRERVLAMWHDPGQFTWQACEMESGLSRRWLYDHLGPRLPAKEGP